MCCASTMCAVCTSLVSSAKSLTCCVVSACSAAGCSALARAPSSSRIDEPTPGAAPARSGTDSRSSSAGTGSAASEPWAAGAGSPAAAGSLSVVPGSRTRPSSRGSST
eukprot:scaffold33638_cov56-Isochrysis_galbana.AAC.1